MKSTKVSYLAMIIFHAFIALIIYFIPFLSKIYAILIFIIGFIIVYRSKNKNNEVLFVSAYLVGAEVLLRMTGGNLNNEYVKFSVMFFMIYGMIYSNFSRIALIYLVFILLLIPAVFVTVLEAGNSIDIKKVLFFNLSGPFCLAICSIYMYKRKIGFHKLENILMVMGFPIISTTVYLFLYTPNIRDVVTGTQSNFETSGGFGPNQVSTILGLGMFIFFTRLILFSKSKLESFINVVLFAFISFRGIVTFSRGGIITGVVMIVCLLFLFYFFSNTRGKIKLKLVFVLTGLLSVSIWTYSSFQTKGLIEKRYANKDARGREKTDRLGGREQIMDAEIKLFIDNAFLGVGAGLSKYKRAQELGGEVASHNEITRLLAEHGVFGILAFLILFATPIVGYINNIQHLYFFSFFLFWLLTINHAAMRTAAPAFVYALCLLSVQIKIPEKTESTSS
ncbi:O-antigen ligase family protein [Flavobacterium sp. LPB0248]|uniref:O-antigen ligase family protein n=1 Tax=Flavobacterium sp. LPB0248 TaxID=2614441 RepID=UPI0015A61FF8|nr:O-antigen ligase family protein [Flavobacterium sp. LPB0248]QLC67518.1 O-antigen ligase family protein [Flavobacterium sp. LPB0248]